jgi:hypothetical protein
LWSNNKYSNFSYQVQIFYSDLLNDSSGVIFSQAGREFDPESDCDSVLSFDDDSEEAKKDMQSAAQALDALSSERDSKNEHILSFAELVKKMVPIRPDNKLMKRVCVAIK